VANERVYVVRRSSQTSDERDLSHNTLAQSFPGVFSKACSKTSTCESQENTVHDRDRVTRRVERSAIRKRRREEKRTKKKGQKKRGGEKTKKPRVRVSSLSPLDVQSALTDAAAVSHSDSVDVCGRITAKVFDARV
jgi:hypothetical protein